MKYSALKAAIGFIGISLGTVAVSMPMEDTWVYNLHGLEVGLWENNFEGTFSGVKIEGQGSGNLTQFTPESAVYTSNFFLGGSATSGWDDANIEHYLENFLNTKVAPKDNREHHPEIVHWDPETDLQPEGLETPVARVPEPGTLALLSAGFLGLIAARRRRTA